MTERNCKNKIKKIIRDIYPNEDGREEMWEGQEAEGHPPRLIDKYIPRTSHCLHVASTVFKQHGCLIIHLTPSRTTGGQLCVGVS